MDDAGKIVREVKVASEPEALLAVLKNLAYHFKRIGLEAGPLSQWLFSALAEAGLPVICVETRHMQAVLKAQINKTDRNDARGIAQMMRAGLYRPVHVKTIRSQKLRMLLTHRKLLQSKAIAIENDLRGTLRNFGLKVGVVGKVKFEARIKDLIDNLPDLAVLVEPMLTVRRVLRDRPTADRQSVCPRYRALCRRCGDTCRRAVAGDQAAMRRSSADAVSASGLRATATRSVCENSRPIAAPIWATSLAGPSRSRRALVRNDLHQNHVCTARLPRRDHCYPRNNVPAQGGADLARHRRRACSSSALTLRRRSSTTKCRFGRGSGLAIK